MTSGVTEPSLGYKWEYLREPIVEMWRGSFIYGSLGRLYAETPQEEYVKVASQAPEEEESEQLAGPLL